MERENLPAFPLRKGLLFLLLMLVCQFGFSQTGPAGIGNSEGSNGQPKLVLWLDASQLSLTDGAKVDTWNDLSGNDNHLTQSTSSYQPTFRQTGMNGRPVVEFDGSNDLLNGPASNALIGITDELSVIAVYSSTDGNDRYLASLKANSNTSSLLALCMNFSGRGNAGYLTYDEWGSNWPSLEYNGGYNDGKSHIITGTISGRTRNLHIDSDFKGWDSKGLYDNPGTGVFTLGGQGVNTRNINAKVSEFLIYSGYLNEVQRKILENYLSQKYGTNIGGYDYFGKLPGYNNSYLADYIGMGQEASGNIRTAVTAGLYLGDAGSSLSNGDYLIAAHNNTPNDAAVNLNLPFGVEERWKRDWYIEKTGSLNPKLTFDFEEGFENGLYPQAVDNYVLLHRSATSGNYSVVNTSVVTIGEVDQVVFEITDANFENGYYTLGTKDKIKSPVKGKPGVTWYALASGDWNNPDIWTLDPAAAIPNNTTPPSFPKLGSDNVVIKSGKTVVLNEENISCSSLTVDGRLEIKTNSRPAFSEIKGSGRIILQKDNFPAGDVTHFISKGKGEGTVVLAGGNYNLTTNHTFYNLEVDLAGASNSVTLLNDYTINGDLLIRNGIFRVNNTSSTARNIAVDGNVTIETNGQMAVGTGNAFHKLVIKGDFTNKGKAFFTNRGANYQSSYYTSMATNGVVEVNFTNEAANQTVLCNGPTYFYDIIVDKGIDDTYICDISASSTANFKLLGQNNGLMSGDEGSRIGAKALRLLAGTARLGSNIVIPTLALGNSYDIDSDACLWLADGANVGMAYIDGSVFVIYGALHISGAKTIFTNNTQYGVLLRDKGVFKIEDGTANLDNFRTSSLGVAGTHQGAYIQRGGVVNVRGEGIEEDYAPFHLPYKTNVFQMSGGVLNIESVHSYDTDGDRYRDDAYLFALVINSQEGSYNVTGGEVIIDMKESRNYQMTSRAPFYNFTIKNSNATGRTLSINAYNDPDGNVDNTEALPLKVLNDFAIEGTHNPTFSPGANDVEIGRDFKVESRATYNSTSNITRFNGDENAVIRNFTGSNLQFYKIDIAKERHTTSGDFYELSMDETGRAIQVNNKFTISRGAFEPGKFNPSFRGDIEIVDGEIRSSGAGVIQLEGNISSHKLKGASDKEQSFGSLKLVGDYDAVVLESNVNVENFSFATTGYGKVLSGTYNFHVTGALTGFSGDRYVQTAGTAGDGGLSLDIVLENRRYSGIIKEYPIGVAGKYTPVFVKTYGITAATSGTLAINPVNEAHPAADPKKASEVLGYYWQTKVSGFDHLTNNVVQMDFQYTPGITKKLAGQRLEGTDWIENRNDISGNTIVFSSSASSPGFTKFIDGDFTGGKDKPFNNVKTFFSRRSGDWFDVDNPTWVNESGGLITRSKDLPGRGDIVVIRNGDRIEVPTNSSTITIGMLKFDHDTTISHEFEDLPRLQIRTRNTVNLNRITGTGMLTQYLDDYGPYNPKVNGDFGDFAKQKYSWFLYVAEDDLVYIPPTPTVFPNVATEGDGKELSFYQDVTINGNLNPRGNSTLLMYAGDDGDILVKGDVLVGDHYDGKIVFARGNTSRTLVIEGNLDFTQATTGIAPTDAREISVQYPSSGSSALEHRIILHGDLIQGVGKINCFERTEDYWGIRENRLIFEFAGEKSATVSKTGSGKTDFYRVDINKPETEQVHFTNGFQLLGPTRGRGLVKALTLKSGECFLDHKDIDINLSTGDDDFKIPATSTLRVKSGAKTKVSGDDTGIWLDGKLIVDNQGSVLCNGGTNNYIEYTASGSANITVEAGTLRVGSQIRRSTITDEGVLTFNQNKAASTITIGETDAPVGNRGVFEILNSGSSFKQEEPNSNITIVRQQTAPTVAALYFNPDVVNISTGSGFTLGNALTPANQEIGVYGGKPMANLTVNAHNNPVAKLWTVSLTLNENLVIESGATCDANGLDLTLKGNFTNNGTYLANGNTTYFEGNSDQMLTGNTTFYNLTKRVGANKLQLAANTDITIENTTSLLTGVFDSGENSVWTKGDVDCRITCLCTGASKGVVFNGTDLQSLSGGGIFDRLSVYNIHGVEVPTEAVATTITDKLRLERGVFNIGKNLLVLQKDAVIEEGAPFSEYNMIQTNISFTDAGIKKYFPVITSDETFVYPIGSTGKYTPVTLDIKANGNSTGSIRVKAANEKHLSIVDDAETETQEIVDGDNVLQYNWTLDAEGIEGFTGVATMKNYPEDVKVTSPYSSADYITARLLSNSIKWEKFFVEDFNERNNELKFTFGATDDNGIDGDYTAGVTYAIPDQVPVYITFKSGPWTNTKTWATYNPDNGAIGGEGVGVPAGGPRGSVIYVKNILTMPANFMAAYRSRILDGGVLTTGNTLGHRLGTVSGTGKIVLESGNLPAGVYDEFLCAGGGTLEFTGTGKNYDVLSEIPAVNNVIFSGTGNRRLPNLDFVVHGELTLDGATIVNEHNCSINAKGNVKFESGNFDARNGTLCLSGNGDQDVMGSAGFTATNGLYNLEINNTTGANLLTDVDVSNNLLLTKGIINTKSGKRLTVTNTDRNAVVGGGASSYVDGPLQKSINGGASFLFPVGNGNRYGQITVSDVSANAIWEAVYHNDNPESAGLTPSEVVDPVKYVSRNEYWRVKGPASSKANVKLRWDGGSGITPDDKLRIVTWESPAHTGWKEVAISAPNITDQTLGTSSVLNFNEFSTGSYFTFGAIYIPDYFWLGKNTNWHDVTNWSNSVLPGASSDVTINSGVTNYPLITGKVQVHNLNIRSSADVELAEGSQFTVNGDMDIQGNFKIHYSTEKVTSFLPLGNLTGTKEAEVNFTFPSRKWWYFGHAVDGVTSGNYSASNTGNLFLYQYDTSNSEWTRITNNTTSFNIPLNGYHANFKDPRTVTTKGLLHNDDYSIGSLIYGWHLMANPYSSYVDLDLEKTDPGTYWTFKDVSKYVYMRTFIGSERVAVVYDINNPYASHPEASRYLAPMQAFWVKSFGNGTLGVSKKARKHDPEENKFKGAVLSPDNVIKLTLGNQYTYDYSAVAFHANGAESFTMNDGEKCAETSKKISQLYTLKGEVKTVINVLPEIEKEKDVPVYITVGSQAFGDQTLKAINIGDFNEDVSVTLEDLVNGTKVDLRENPEYHFTSDPVTDQQRFIIHFGAKEDISTDINEKEEDQYGVLITGKDGKIKVNLSGSLVTPETPVEIYSIDGAVVYSGRFNGDHFEHVVPRDRAYYLVKLSIGEEVISEKIFVED